MKNKNKNTRKQNARKCTFKGFKKLVSKINNKLFYYSVKTATNFLDIVKKFTKVYVSYKIQYTIFNYKSSL